MPNKYVNKVVIGKETKLDLTADTITPDKLAKGITAHDKSGAPITGTSTKDADTSDATAAVAEVLNGKTFYARGAKMTGTTAKSTVKSAPFLVSTPFPWAFMMARAE